MSIRFKILGSFIGFIFLIVSILSISVSQIVENSIRENIDSNFDKTGQIFERFQEIRYRQLRQTAVLLADLPSLKAAISTKDIATVDTQIKNEIKYVLDFYPTVPDSLLSDALISNTDSVGLLLVTDVEGFPLGQMSASPLPSHSLAAHPGILNAIEGNYPETSQIWEQGQRFFNVVTVPIWTRNRLMGTLSLGMPMHPFEVRQFSKDTGNEVIYFINNSVYLSTLSELTEMEEIELSRGIYDAAFELSGETEAITIERTLGDQDWLFYITAMNQGNTNESINGYYVVARSLTQEIKPLRRVQSLILITGVLVAIIAFVIGYIITHRINSPIQQLIKGIGRIEQGDYQHPVPVTTNDEIGVLTETFNNLVLNLKERLLMLKFVSEATIDAVKNSISDIELGGRREDVTVFFSDIRGFTKWSEKRAPEEVIDMINTLLRFQAEIIKSHQGDIDKFVGDEVVAIFRGENKEQHAVNAAIQIQQKCLEILKQYKDELAIGIGINTGEVVLGAMGSEQRMDYTVLGNNVNLGARLCSAARPYQVLLTENVSICLERRIVLAPLSPIKVKGIENPVPIYEVVWENYNIKE